MTVSNRPTRPEKRAARAAAASRALHQALDAHDVTQEDIAARLGVTQCQVSRWASAQTLDALPLHDVSDLPDEVAVELLRPVVARLGYSLAQLPVTSDAAGAGHEIEMLARLASESAQAVAAFAQSLQKGHDRTILRAALLECTEAVEALMAVQARVSQQIAGLDAVARPVVRAVAR